MMKKVLFGVAMTILSGASVATLQSCKDDVSDLKTQTSFDLNQLKNDLDKRAAELQEQITQNKNDIQSLLASLNEYAKITWVQGELDKLQEKINTNAGNISGIQGDIVNLKGDIQTINGKISALEQADADLLSQINGALGSIADLQGKYSDLKNDYDALNTIVSGNTNKIADLEGRVAANEAAITTINTALENLNSAIADANTRIDGVDARVDEVNVRVDGLEATVETINGDLQLTKENVEELKEKVYFLRQDLDALRQDFENLSSNVTLLTERVDALENSLEALSGRIDDMMTGILVQATDSPVFGNFSLPLGVKSSLLFNWYGDNKTGISQFPNNEYSEEYEYNDANVDFNVPGMEKVSVMDGVIGDVNLGRVYLTLNPVGHYFDTNNFFLETSNGTQLPVSINVQKSNDQLTFGYSRDREQVEGNGFYAADVTITGDENERSKGVQAARIAIDDNLKSAVKDILHDRTKRNAVDLLKAVYGQLNGKLPAYAVRYNWTNSGKDYSVLSNYDLAVATARPLSYNFYKDGSISKKLPTFGHINNVLNELKGKFQIKFTPISFKDVTIELPAIDFSDVKAEGPGLNITLNVGDVIIRDDAGNVIGKGKPEITLDGLDNINDQIAESMQKTIDQLTGKISGWTEDANASISDQLQKQLDPIANQINDMVANLQGQIDDMVDDIAGKAEPWFDRVNRVVDLYNRFAEKVNTMLENPNHYLQVAMFYNQVNSGVGVLSNSIDSPTPFVGNGNVGLYASSYTGEIVAPAFKKYVACTNVYDMNKNVPANAGALAYEVNQAAKNFNKVVDGNVIRYAIPASSLKKGYIYEIVYQGLDYSGITSTQKFYITVNKF